jgi:serine/threonine protein kinase
MSTPATAARLIGRYLLFGEIASGGMATVHFGRLSGPAGFARTVAIKRLHPQFAKDPEFVSMFLDEARLAARIRHPNVVQTLDVVATQGEIFLVMDYVQGESLARLLRSVRAMTMTPADARVVATVMSGVLHGLHAAHEATNEQAEPLGIVHRDVSPQNILVGVDGVPRVLDFGVAKAVGRLQTTREGQIKGKIAYMAPEQLNGAPVTRQTDVYAAAVVTWEALTGTRLFQGDNEAAVVTAILQKPVPVPSRAGSQVPLSFDRVVMRGLERDPARRYATAREMAVDMERCVGIEAASGIGEWVESVAHDQLRARASRVAEIESLSSSVRRPCESHGTDSRRSSRPPPSLPSVGEIPTTRAETTLSAIPDPKAEAPSVRSSLALSSLPFATPSRPKGWSAILAAGTAIALLFALVVLVAFRQGRATALAAVAVRPDPSAAPPASATPIVESSAVASAGTAADTSASVPPPTHRRPVLSVFPTASVRPALDCDPPFTIDAIGHKHYKLACLH